MEASSDLSYYTEPRYPGKPEEIIGRFASATRGLLARLEQDLRSPNKSAFAGEADQRLVPLAAAVGRASGHVDVFEAMALAGSGDPASDTIVRNVLSNVIGDSGMTEIAEVHTSAPHAKEGKFDQHKGGALD